MSAEEVTVPVPPQAEISVPENLPEINATNNNHHIDTNNQTNDDKQQPEKQDQQPGEEQQPAAEEGQPQQLPLADLFEEYDNQPNNRKSNILTIWGNKQTMNLNHMVHENVVQSPYYRNKLADLNSCHELIDEIYYNVCMYVALYCIMYIQFLIFLFFKKCDGRIFWNFEWKTTNFYI